MFENELETVKQVLMAIENGWVLFDEKDEDDFMVFVDENRKTHPNLKPKKSLIALMEDHNFIQVIEKETKRTYMKAFGKKHPMSMIALYAIADKGKALLEK